MAQVKCSALVSLTVSAFITVKKTIAEVNPDLKIVAIHHSLKNVVW